ncbi:MAG TPA: hypothetical protein VF172_13565 [Nitrososphaera sp.]
MIEGVARPHAKKKIPSGPALQHEYWQARQQASDINVNERIVGNDIIIAINSTGIKVANRGESGCGTNLVHHDIRESILCCHGWIY